MRRTTLESEYDWYVQQAANPENPPEIQRLWQQLADELRPFIASSDQAPLW